MELRFVRSKWDMPELPLPVFLERVKRAGFDGTEIHFENESEDPSEIEKAHRNFGLQLVAMITTEGQNPAEHIASFKRKLAFVRKMNPMHVNCHTGKDYFSQEENASIFEEAISFSTDLNLSVSHETHRGRATFAAHTTRSLLAKLPELRLTADFSHWCCVHESLLADQQSAMEMAIGRSTYIHARVGHMEGPQVSDPRAPEWKTELDTHVGWWKDIAGRRRQQGSPFLAICPEFGPAPYMPSLPYTRQPVAHLWEITVYMMNLLRTTCGN
jgi:sugar phosphate isomerase/epimerase